MKKYDYSKPPYDSEMKPADWNTEKEKTAPKIDLNAIPCHIQSVMVYWNRKEIGLEE